MFVRVAIDLALDKLFSYAVGAEFAEKLQIGQLLRVPFSGRIARGFAIAIDEFPPADVPASKMRAILGIEDEIPFFTPSMLELAKWMAAYTLTPIETCLKSCVPAAVLREGAHAKEQLFVSVANNAPSVAPTMISRRRQQLLCDIARIDGGWLNDVVKELKTTAATIKKLADAGYLQLENRQRRRDPLAGRRMLPSQPKKLNPTQQAALELICNNQCPAKPILLFGVTGSGKTEVYLQAIAAELACGRGAIVLVPEISLTPQTVRRFASRFGEKVAVLHSALSDGERFDEWHRIRKGEARVVVGPRSAVFAPVRNLGLIVVDEEHDGSYKQEESPRYHARDVAVMRGKYDNCKVVLGSATPSIESWHNAQIGKYRLAKLPGRVEGRAMPNVTLVDMAKAKSTTGFAGIFSSELLDAIAKRLARNEQTILFLNRRGYARVWRCDACGWTASCRNCAGLEGRIPYTYHLREQCLRCHICGAWERLPQECPECKGREFSRTGIGTERAEIALSRCFPRAKILRMDRDSTSRKDAHDEILSQFGSGRADILLGTQMIAKGLDFPNVTLVGVLNADQSLAIPDFRAEERTFQLLAQVSGRAGRAEKPGEVFFQTFDPDARAIRLAANENSYPEFAEQELENRKQGFYPPWSRFAILHVKGSDSANVSQWCAFYAENLKRFARESPNCGRLEVSGATPAFLEQVEGVWRWQVTLRGERAKSITSAVSWLVKYCPPPKGIQLALDVDALNMM